MKEPNFADMIIAISHISILTTNDPPGIIDALTGVAFGHIYPNSKNGN